MKREVLFHEIKKELMYFQQSLFKDGEKSGLENTSFTWKGYVLCKGKAKDSSISIYAAASKITIEILVKEEKFNFIFYEYQPTDDHDEVLKLFRKVLRTILSSLKETENFPKNISVFKSEM